MRLYDRVEGVYTDKGSLPKDLDLGRYVTQDHQDLTNSIFDTGTDYYIHQELLSENDGIPELFQDFGIKVSECGHGQMDIYPLIQSVEDKLVLNEFERYLCDKIPHLESICRQPHYLLQRTIEKVNVSKAKRIPAKTYQYLASHTEDWEQKSILNFKPSRVLTEELDQNFNVYENQLFYALVERCLKYLKGRLKEVNAVMAFVDEYEKLLKIYMKGADKLDPDDAQAKDDSYGWYEKVARNLTLIGGVYDDENYGKAPKEDKKKASATEDALRAAYKKLLQIRSLPLFEEINARVSMNMALRDTNVLVNHKHYRYVRALWVELNKIRPEKTEEEVRIEEQAVIEGLRAYAKTLFAYTVKRLKYNPVLNYELDGSYAHWHAVSPRLADISFKENDDQTFSVAIGRWNLRFVVLGNVSSLDKDALPEDTYLMCYSQEKVEVNDRMVLINPMDPDSMERLGLVINRHLLAEYVLNIQREYEYSSSLRDYVEYINAPWVRFNAGHNRYTYSFVKPGKPIDRGTLSSRLVVGKDIRDDRKKELLGLVDEIERNYQRYVQECLFCFHCHSPLNLSLLDDFKYMRCGDDDGFVLDISQPGKVVLKNVDARYLSDKVDWGLDCLEFTTKDQSV